MTTEASPEQLPVIHLTEVADIVSAFVSNNSIPPADLPPLIAAVHESLANLTAVSNAREVTATLIPAVPIKKSVTPNFLICLDNGKRFKSLKRHLSTLGMTPDDYRAKWGLPSDYPMVASAYSATRSALAKSIGLGNARVPAPKKIPVEKVKGPAKPRGRPKKIVS